MKSIEEMRMEHIKKRKEWRRVRLERFEHRDKLISQGLSKREVRKDKYYRKLKKEQHYLSRVIIHLDKRLNRKTAVYSEQE